MPPSISPYRHFMKNWFAIEVRIYFLSLLVDDSFVNSRPFRCEFFSKATFDAGT